MKRTTSMGPQDLSAGAPVQQKGKRVGVMKVPLRGIGGLATKGMRLSL